MKKMILYTAIGSFVLSMIGGYAIALMRSEYDVQAEITEENRMTQAVPMIGPDTEMVFQYYYSQDKVTKEQVESAAPFLQGLNMEQVRSVYDGWQVILFSPEKVILRCRIDALSSETYILGEKDGFLAVFYEDGQKGIHLKEVTEMPVSALPKEEASCIREGIRVNGEENLARILSDWLS